MIRKTVADATDQEPDFRWRGDEVTRIENLSDIVFALALGMLVSASTPPSTYGDLLRFLLNILPVAAGFAVMLQIWNQHFVFFRRYALTDRRVVLLNAVLLLFVLFFAYPIRFTFDSLFAWGLAIAGFPDRILAMEVDFPEASRILAIYAVGYAMIYVVFGLLYAHVWQRRDALGLNAEERVKTRQTQVVCWAMVLMALVVLPVVLFSPLGPIGGFLFLASAGVRSGTARIVRWRMRGTARPSGLHPSPDTR